MKNKKKLKLLEILFLVFLVFLIVGFVYCYIYQKFSKNNLQIIQKTDIESYNSEINNEIEKISAQSQKEIDEVLKNNENNNRD